MARGIITYLNGKIVEVKDKESAEYEFVNTDVLSPTMISTSVSTLLFPKLGNFEDKDACRIVDEWIENVGITAGIPLKQIDSQTGLEVFSGFVKPHGEKTWKGYQLDVISSYEQFVELAENLNLQDLNPKDASELSRQQLIDLLSLDDSTGLSNAELRDQYDASLIPIDKRLQDSDFVEICYLDKKLDPLEILLLYISIFTVIMEIIKVVKDISDAAGTVSISMVFSTALYLGILTLQLANLIQILFEAIPRVKKGKGIKIETLINKSCEAINFPNIYYSASNPLQEDLYSGLAKEYIIWNSIEQPVPNWTFKKLIDWWCKLFNLKGRVIGEALSDSGQKEVYFAGLKSFWNNPVQYTIPALQEPDEQTENVDDLTTRINIDYLRDIDSGIRKLGENASVAFVEDTGNTQYQLKGKEVSIDIEMTRAYIKEELTREEKFYNLLTGVLGQVITIASPVFNVLALLGVSVFDDLLISTDNVGAIQLKDNFLSNPKLIGELDGCKPSDRNLDLTNAQYIYSEFHDYMNPNRLGQWIYITASATDRDLKIPVGTDASELIRNLMQNPVCDYEYVDKERGAPRKIRAVIRQFKRNPEKRMNYFVLAVRPESEGLFYSNKEFKLRLGTD